MADHEQLTDARLANIREALERSSLSDVWTGVVMDELAKPHRSAAPSRDAVIKFLRAEGDVLLDTQNTVGAKRCFDTADMLERHGAIIIASGGGNA